MRRNNNVTHITQSGKKRPRVHAKSKSSKLKTSRNYKKSYRGQGR